MAASSRLPLWADDHGAVLINLLMAAIVIQIAVITYWFTLADDANGDMGRDAQLYAMQGLGQRAVGSLRSGYDETSAYNNWLELETLARVAERNGNPDEAQRLRAARDRVAKLSPALQPPYFNAGVNSTPNLKAYEADQYLRTAIALGERFQNQSRAKLQWSDKAAAYSLQLTLLAVALFVLGVAASNRRRTRTLFLFIGGGLALGVLVMMLFTYIEPTTVLPEEALDAFAEGAAARYVGDNVAAEAAFNRALTIAPTYLDAYRQRAYARYTLGNLEGADADLEAAAEQGDDSADTLGNLGFIRYRLGEFQDAIPIMQIAAELAPEEFWWRMNAGLALLASGDTAAAQTEYETFFDHITKVVATARSQGQEPGVSLWIALDGGVTDLDALAACATRQVCKDAPPYTSLTNPAELGQAAAALSERLKEYSVALEYTGAPPGAVPNAVIQPFEFTHDLTPDNMPIHAADSFPASDDPVYVYIRFHGLQEGQQLVFKVFVDGVEDNRLRGATNYSESNLGGSDGDILLGISTGGVPLTPGNYVVQLYVDSHLMQTGSFTVVPPSQ